MQKDQGYYIGLLSAYIDDRLAPAQVEELFAFIQLEPMTYRTLLDEPSIKRQLTDKHFLIPEATSHRMLERLLKATAPPVRKLRPIWYAAAATIAAVISLFLLTRSHRQQPVESPAIAKIIIPPGTNKATLTLAEGKTILLDRTTNGQLAIQGSTTITKNTEGLISYNVNGTAAALQNTLTTPRGGQYQLILPDGTKVWVNAASSITYPTAFQSKERRVSIKGEAFFEIAQNKSQPFIVEVQQGPQIQVLGTQFNINAYTDEPSIRTTLISGAVKVQYNSSSLVLKPAQQAKAEDHRLTLNPQPNIDETLAWKNGSFLFHRAPLDIVMRQLARWYDIEVIYTNEVPKILFEGEMKRDLNLSEVLDILRKMEVHCKMDGRRLIVLP